MSISTSVIARSASDAAIQTQSECLPRRRAALDCHGLWPRNDVGLGMLR